MFNRIKSCIRQNVGVLGLLEIKDIWKREYLGPRGKERGKATEINTLDDKTWRKWKEERKIGDRKTIDLHYSIF